MYDDLDRPPLSESELTRALTLAGSRWTHVEVVNESPSTNARLAERAASDERDGLVLVAEHQTAGRGRLDRTWTTPPRAAITMSVLVRPVGVPMSRWPWISLLAGLAVAAAVRRVAGVEAGLKWPNDVVVDDRKLAGLLVERVEGGFGPAAVIGVGLNVSTTRAELPTPYATSLTLEGATTTDRATLVKAILRRLDGLLAQWERRAGTPSVELRAAYRGACVTIGQRVRLEVYGRETVEGVAVGIDESGRLLVHTESGEVAFAAGDVVHVRRPA
ncbi:MAG: BirA family transcriptional regulator [Nocardioidaceae bacterium]|nr:BirA family transcriptional regulator [Nocardioidaceae bacterium]